MPDNKSINYFKNKTISLYFNSLKIKFLIEYFHYY